MYANLKTKLNSIFNKSGLTNFFYGPFYPIIVALFTTIFFVTETQLIGLLLASLTASIIFLRFKDATPIFPLLFLIVLCFRDYSTMNGVLPYILLAPAIIAFILKFFVYPVKNFKPGKLFLPLILVCAALFLSGINSPLNNYAGGLSIMVTIGPTMLIIYTFFSAYVCPPKDFNLGKYLCFLLLILGLTSTAHISFYRISCDVLKNNSFERWELGWGNINCAATLLLPAIASCWYLITQARHMSPYFIVLTVLYFGVFLSNSAGVLGTTLAFLPVLAYFTYKRISLYNRNAYIQVLLVVGGMLVGAVAATVIFFGYEELINMLKPFFSENSRTILYEKAIELFKKYPIFGVGLGFAEEQSSPISISIYNFHSVFFHVVGAMGIVGIVAYTIYYFARFRILMKGYNSFSIFITIAFIMFECYAFIDTAEFNAIPLMSTMTVVMVVKEYLNKKSNDQALPLLMDYHNRVIF